MVRDIYIASQQQGISADTIHARADRGRVKTARDVLLARSRVVYSELMLRNSCVCLQAADIINAHELMQVYTHRIASCIIAEEWLEMLQNNQAPELSTIESFRPILKDYIRNYMPTPLYKWNRHNRKIIPEETIE